TLVRGSRSVGSCLLSLVRSHRHRPCDRRGLLRFSARLVRLVHLRRSVTPTITDIRSFLDAVRGAALIKLFLDRLFGYYGIGLAAGFFLCVAVVGAGWA